MSKEDQTLELRVEELALQLKTLQQRVEELERSEVVPRPSEQARPEAQSPAEASEKVLTWVGRASLLQRSATLCFLLAVALILRTLTDSNLLDKEIGSVIGMVYAAGLIGWGWHGYRRDSPLSPVFAVSGAFLMFSVVVETHEHFESLSTVPAYVLIALTGGAMAAISHLHRVALPVFVGALGMSVAGAVLDFPTPVFPYLFVLLIAANALGTFATRLQRCTWLRWLLLIVTVFMMQVWGFRLGIHHSRMETEAIPFSMTGFFPAVVILGAAFLMIAILGIQGRISERVSRFDYALPAINALWTFAIARYVVNSGLGSEQLLGVFGVIAAVVHFAVAARLGHRRGEGVAGTNALVIGGSVFLLMALPLALGSALISLLAIGAVAFGQGVVSRRWRSGGVRMTSYLLQLYACGALAMSLKSAAGQTEPSVVGALASAALAGLAFWHYLWSRKNPPPLESLVFSQYDKKDRSAAVLLVSALVGGFFTLRVGIYQGLSQALSGGQLAEAFTAGQSVLINAAAAVLMCYAFARRNKEVRNVAILVTIIGAFKVFLFDLFGLKGVPVVASVLSFGAAAFIESFALSRWQRIDALRVSKWPPEEAGEEIG